MASGGAAAVRQLVVKFVGMVDPTLGKAAATVNSRIKGSGTEAGKTAAKTAAIAAAAVAVAGAAVKMGKDSVKAFQNAATETIPFKRNLGLSAEEASRLRFQLKMSGVDLGAAGKATTIFAKNLQNWLQKDEALKATTEAKTKAIKAQIAALEAAGPSTAGYTEKMAALKAKLAAVTAQGEANENALTKLGIAYSDAEGNARPMSALLPEIAEKFKTMPDGPEKTALAMKLFGKNGAAMLPFLNKGAAGLAELAAQSDKFGETLTGDNLAALVASKKAQREWDAAVEGFQVQFGAKLLPLLTAGATTITGVLIPAMNGAAAFFRDNQTAIGTTATVVGVLTVAYGALVISQNAQAAGGFVKYLLSVGQATKAWAIVQGALNVVMSANPIALVVIAIAALVAGIIYAYNNCKEFRQVVDVAFKAIADAGVWLWNNALQPALKGIVMGFGWVMDGLAAFLDGLGNIPGFEWAKGAAASVRDVGKAARDAANGINQIPIKKRVVVSASDEASAKLASVKSQLAELKDKLVRAKAEGDATEVDKLKKKIDDLKDKKVKLQAEVEKGTVISKVKIVAGKGNGAAKFQMIAMAGGGILGGGERHVAQIARAGAYRLWAEPETGGEGYVPLAPGKRSTSVPIWWEIGRRLGVVQYANGGVSGGQLQPSTVGELIAAIRALGLLITSAQERLVNETLRAAGTESPRIVRLG